METNELLRLLSPFAPWAGAAFSAFQIPKIIDKWSDYKIKAASVDLEAKAAKKKIEADTEAGEAAQQLKERQDGWISLLNSHERLQKERDACEEHREEMRKHILELSIQVGINSQAVNGITQAVNDKILPENEKLEIIPIQPSIQKAMNEAKNDEIQPQGTT